VVGAGAYGCISHIIARYSVCLSIRIAAPETAPRREQRTENTFLFCLLRACCFVFGSAQPSALSPSAHSSGTCLVGIYDISIG
jgi:hypothetical protein